MKTRLTSDIYGQTFRGNGLRTNGRVKGGKKVKRRNKTKG